MALSDAFVAAWLPGTTGGQAVVGALFGDYVFRNHDNVNTLPVPWPTKALKDFPIYDSDAQPTPDALF
jgi:beta-glucosidase